MDGKLLNDAVSCRTEMQSVEFLENISIEEEKYIPSHKNRHADKGSHSWMMIIIKEEGLTLHTFNRVYYLRTMS